MADLTAIAPRVDPPIRRLATNHDDERLAVVVAVQRTLTTAEADFHDLADCVIVGAKPSAERDTSPRHRWRAPTPDPGTMLLALLDQQALNRWEASFVQSVYGQYRQGRILSDKQLNIICQIWIKTEHAT